MTAWFNRMVGALFEIAALIWFIGAVAIPYAAFVPLGVCFAVIGIIFLRCHEE